MYLSRDKSYFLTSKESMPAWHLTLWPSLSCTMTHWGPPSKGPAGIVHPAVACPARFLWSRYPEVCGPFQRLFFSGVDFVLKNHCTLCETGTSNNIVAGCFWGKSAFLHISWHIVITLLYFMIGLVNNPVYFLTQRGVVALGQMWSWYSKFWKLLKVHL